MSRSDEQLQALSAFIDSEVDELEARRVSAALADDDELRVAWRRYHLIGALLRDEVIRPEATQNVASMVATHRLRAALAQEAALAPEALLPPAAASAALTRPAPLWGRRWYAGGLGLATAAGLAGGLWLGGANVPVVQAQLAAQQLAVSATGREVTGLQAPAVEQVVRQPWGHEAQGFDSQRRARLYMLMHAQQTGLSQHPQGISMVKFVSYLQRPDDQSNNRAR